MVVEGAIRTASAAKPRMASARMDLDDVVLCQRLGVQQQRSSTLISRRQQQQSQQARMICADLWG
jgi:hypothetical protein